jgi:hypothetical protein
MAVSYYCHTRFVQDSLGPLHAQARTEGSQEQRLPVRLAQAAAAAEVSHRHQPQSAAAAAVLHPVAQHPEVPMASTVLPRQRRPLLVRWSDPHQMWCCSSASTIPKLQLHMQPPWISTQGYMSAPWPCC